MNDQPTLRLGEETVRHGILHDTPSAALIEADSLRNLGVCSFAIKRNGCKHIEAVQSPQAGCVMVLQSFVNVPSSLLITRAYVRRWRLG